MRLAGAGVRMRRKMARLSLPTSHSPFVLADAEPIDPAGCKIIDN